MVAGDGNTAMGRDAGSDVTSLIFLASALGHSVHQGRTRGTREERCNRSLCREQRGKEEREIPGARCAATGAANFHYFVASLNSIYWFGFFLLPPFSFLTQMNSGKSQLSAYK